MASKEPGFLNSPYFVNEPGNWHLKPGAPEHIRLEFQEFMENDEAESSEIAKVKQSDLK